MLETKLFSDVDFIVEDETRVPAHSSMVAARSQFLRSRIRQAQEVRDKLLEEVLSSAVYGRYERLSCSSHAGEALLQGALELCVIFAFLSFRNMAQLKFTKMFHPLK